MSNKISSHERPGAVSQKKQSARTAGTESETSQAFLGNFLRRYLEKTAVISTEN